MLLRKKSFDSTIISSARFSVSDSTVVWTVTQAGAIATDGDTRMTRRSAPLSGPAMMVSDTHANTTAFIINVPPAALSKALTRTGSEVPERRYWRRPSRPANAGRKPRATPCAPNFVRPLTVVHYRRARCWGVLELSADDRISFRNV